MSSTEVAWVLWLALVGSVMVVVATVARFALRRAQGRPAYVRPVAWAAFVAVILGVVASLTGH